VHSLSVTPEPLVVWYKELEGLVFNSLLEEFMYPAAPEHKVVENPYLARQLSVFDDRQLVTGLPEMIVRGHRHMQNSTMNAETTIYIGLVHRNNVSIPTSSMGEIIYCALCFRV
jgi:hypothetical protein